MFKLENGHTLWLLWYFQKEPVMLSSSLYWSTFFRSAKHRGGSRKTDRVVRIWCTKNSENFILLINYYQSLALNCSRVYNKERAILQVCVLTKSTTILILKLLIIIQEYYNLQHGNL